MKTKYYMIKSKYYTAVLEFEVIAPTDQSEKAGDKYSLTKFGEYLSENKIRSCSLLHMLEHPAHYRVSKIRNRGKSYIVPNGRPLNQSPLFHPETEKYYRGTEEDKKQFFRKRTTPRMPSLSEIEDFIHSMKFKELVGLKVHIGGTRFAVKIEEFVKYTGVHFRCKTDRGIAQIECSILFQLYEYGAAIDHLGRETKIIS